MYYKISLHHVYIYAFGDFMNLLILWLARYHLLKVFLRYSYPVVYYENDFRTTLVQTNVGLAYSFVDTIRTSIVRIPLFFDTSRVCHNIFCFRYHLGLYTMQEPSYLGKITQVSICSRMVSTQIITWLYKYFLILTYPSNINIHLVSQFSYPWVGSLLPFLVLIIDTMHSPIY